MSHIYIFIVIFLKNSNSLVPWFIQILYLLFLLYVKFQILNQSPRRIFLLKSSLNMEVIKLNDISINTPANRLSITSFSRWLLTTHQRHHIHVGAVAHLRSIKVWTKPAFLVVHGLTLWTAYKRAKLLFTIDKQFIARFLCCLLSILRSRFAKWP